MERVYKNIATFFGAGESPVAPGTAGSLAAIPLYLCIRGLGLRGYLTITSLITIVGTIAAHKAETYWGKDPGKVVIDEVAGMLLTLLSRPRSAVSILAGFLIFRVLDILKPPPVGALDKNVKGGLGIMADDVAAGIMGAGIMKIATRLGWLR